MLRHILLIVTYSPTSIKRPPIKRPPSIKRPLSKVPIYLSVNCCIWYLYSTATSIKRTRPPFSCHKYVLDMFFLPPLSGQQIIFPSIWRIILNKSSVNYLELNFFTYELLMLNGLRNLSTIVCTFLYIINQKKYCTFQLRALCVRARAMHGLQMHLMF